MDTLLEQDVEDVGEIELEAAEPLGAVAAAPRRSALAGQEEEEEEESMGLRALAIGTTAVLVLTIPVTLSVSTGHTSDIAKVIAGLFGADIR